MQIMRTILCFSLFLLAACDQGGVMPFDAQKLLGTMDGPKVPTMQDTLLESAKASEKQGNFAQAAQYYQQALEKKPEDKDLALGLADSYRRNGEFDRAIALYDGLIAQNPSMVAAKEGKGLALMAKGDFDAPAPLFDDVMKVDPKRWKTLNALGILFVTRNMHKEAQQYYEEALKFSPSNPSILNNLGLTQALDKNYDAGTANLLKASALTAANSPERKHIDLNLALVYAIAGKTDEARTITAQYYSGPALDNNMGLYAHLAKDDQMAKAYLNMALTDSKTFYEKAWDNLQNISSGSQQSPSPKGFGQPDISRQLPTVSVPAGKPAPKGDEIMDIVTGDDESEKKPAKKK